LHKVNKTNKSANFSHLFIAIPPAGYLTDRSSVLQSILRQYAWLEGANAALEVTIVVAVTNE
jgi:hypothetical protein